jgi:hypothetical protein
VPAHKVGDLGSPALRPVLDVRPGSGEEDGERRRYLVDRLEGRRQVMAARKLEQDHRPVRSRTRSMSAN